MVLLRSDENLRLFYPKDLFELEKMKFDDIELSM